MKFDLRQHTHLLTLGGSWSYGLNTETSDVDIKGILIPPLEEYRLGILDNLEQVDSQEEMVVFNDLLPPVVYAAMVKDCLVSNSPITSAEGVVYDIKKFFSLALNANPNILEVLWVDPADILLSTEIGDALRANRNLFLSKKVLYSYRGYAFAQMKRVKTHRSWLLNPPASEPKREDYDLPPDHSLLSQDEQNACLWVLAQILKDKIGSFKLSETTRQEIEELSIYDAASAGIPEEAWPIAGKIIGAPKEFIDIMMRERAYRNARNYWKSYQNWKETRNPKRAALEARSGFDTKSASHLVRLMLQCRDILDTQELKVRLPKEQRDFTIGVKEGQMAFNELERWFDEQEKDLSERAAKSSLPKEPNRKRANELLIELQLRAERKTSNLST